MKTQLSFHPVKPARSRVADRPVACAAARVAARTARAAMRGAACALALALLAALTGVAHARTVRVVTTTEDLAAIAREVGGQRVSVEYLAHGYEDPHFVDAKPSFVLKLQKADVFVEVGRELEIGWIPPLLTNARNPKILPGGPNFVDASAAVRILEVPTGQVTRAMGDVHPFGNPHFWLDPDNAEIIAREIRDRLARVDPAGAAYYKQREADFERRLSAAEKRWKDTARQIGLTGAKIVTYHNSWPYFAKEFGCTVVDFVEPRPGIPPSASHTAELIAKMKDEKVRVLIVEPYFDQKLPAKISRETGVPHVVLPPSVDEKSGMKSYTDLIDRQLAILAKALGASGRK
jgi:zinc/manganese transport system substrate-binding protein